MSYQNIPIIVRASEIIDYIGENHNGKSASDLLRIFDLPKTSCYRILHTLVEYEFLIKDTDTGLYYLGKKFSDFSTIADNKFHLLKKIAHPYLKKLSQKTQETTKISVLSNRSCYVLDTVEGPKNIKISVNAGAVFPLHAGAASKILFLSMGNRSRDIILNKGLEQFTPLTITTQADMLAEFERITERGMSLDSGEYIEGIGALACPVFDYSSKIIAAISVAYATLNTDTATIESFIPHIKATAQAISVEFSKSCTDATFS